jgi:hypothetical protein
MMTRQDLRKSMLAGMRWRLTSWPLVLIVGLFTVLGLVHARTRLAVLDLHSAVGRVQLENHRLHRELRDLQLQNWFPERRSREL